MKPDFRRTLHSVLPIVAAFVATCTVTIAQTLPGTQVLRSDAQELVVQVGLRYTTTQLATGELLPRVNGAAMSNGSQPGAPIQMLVAIPVALPGESGNSVEIISAEYDAPISGRLAPVPAIEYENGVAVEKYRVDQAAYARPVATVPAAALRYDGLTRDVHAGAITISPYRYDPSTNSIQFLRSIKVRVRFGATPTASRGRGVLDDLTRTAFVNANVAANWSVTPATRSSSFGRRTAASAARAWIRVEVKEDGLYELVADDFQKAGIDLKTVTPDRIAVYGGRGGDLPEKVAAIDSNRMNRIPVTVETAGGQISRVLFYAAGPSRWEHFYFNDTNPRHMLSAYSFTNSYIVSIDGEGPRGYTQQPGLGAPTVFPSFGIGRIFVEEDLVNAIDIDRNGSGSGRAWFGRKFEVDASRNTETWVSVTSLPGLERSTPITYRIRMAHSGRSGPGLPSARGLFAYFEQDRLIGYDTISSIGGAETAKASTLTKTFPNAEGVAPDNRSTLKIQYSCLVPASAFIDWYEIHYGRRLVAENNQITFDAPSGGGVAEFRVTGFTTDNLVGYDITDPANPIELRRTSTSGGTFVFSDALRPAKQTRRYFITDRAQPKRVAAVSKATFADLRNRAFNTDIIVVTNEELRGAAQKYADYRNGQGEFSAAVVTTEEIYTEFGFGNPDPTAIRDYLGHAYRNWSKRPSYVLFIGDATYDYRNIANKQKQFVPPYENDYPDAERYDDVSSSGFDDYYTRISGENNTVDLASGRFPVTTAEEVEVVLNKIKLYENTKNFGLWRATMIFSADDAVPNDVRDFVRQSETVWGESTPHWVEAPKVYLPFYPTEQVAQRRKPGATQDLLQAINRGAVITNWLGHGNPRLWAHELLIEKDEFIPRLTNDSLLTFVTAATCNFGFYDDPSVLSGAEMFLLRPNTGAIAVMSAARASYVTQNEYLIRAVFDTLFRRDPMTERYRTIGMALALVKNTNPGGDWDNTQKYHIFGDPVLRLNLPQDSVEITSINTTDLKTDTATVAALSLVTVKGVVCDLKGVVREDFNGTAIVTLYDATRKDSLVEEQTPQVMHYYGGRLFRGPTTVTNGRFESVFRVPKDIAYDSINARLHVYAYSSTRDAVGATPRVRVYGTETVEISDSAGPAIQLFVDDRTFQYGDIVTPVPKLIVDLYDTSGVNSSGSGLGHRIEAWIDDNPNSIDLTEDYQTLPTDYRRGAAEKIVNDLEPGEHRVRVRAWDIFNNPAEATTLFRIVEGGSEELEVANVVNYPNPMSRETDFTFRHNQARPLDVEIAIFTPSGRKVRDLEARAVTDRFVRIHWDGTDSDGDALANGVYMYRLRVRVVGVGETGATKEFETIDKVAIVR